MAVDETPEEKAVAPPDDKAHAAWLEWRANPSPDTLGAAVRALQPAIDYSLGRIGGHDNKRLRHKAKLYAADAVRTWDPAAGAKLGSWAVSQMRRLSRAQRELSQPVAVPERTQIDAMHISRKEAEFMEANGGREPDLGELADFSGFSPKRIRKVREQFRPVVSEETIPGAAHSEPDYASEAADIVYDSLDHVDRRVMELKTGYGGYGKLAPKEIAAKLGLSPTQLTRRSARIQMRLNEAMEILGEGGAG